MFRLAQKLLLYLAAASDRDLICQIEYLKAENEILRSKLPKRITVTRGERLRLLTLGKAVGAAIKHLVSIVTPHTFARWLSKETAPAKAKQRYPKPGRPRTQKEIRDLVLQLARDNRWGFGRIVGELRKLGVVVSKSTVKNILKENGINPAPVRNGSWSDFIKRHLQTLWACDFFSKRVVCRRGIVDIFVLFFMHIGSRRVFVSGISANPDSVWMKQQAKNFSMTFADTSTPPKYLIMDLDSKFTAEFRDMLKGDGVESIRVGPCKPNLNAHTERFVLSIKTECLDHFVVFGQKHLQYLIDQYLVFYNRERPHQGMENQPLSQTESQPAIIPFPNGEVVCDERLGGLLKHYHRQAA